MEAQTEFKEREYFAQSFKSLNLSGQTFDAKVFEDCIFKECDFSEALLNGCQFIECEFIKCNMSVLKIVHSTFSTVTFTECKLIGIDWTKANWSEIAFSAQLKFYQCNLNDCSFFGLMIPGIIVAGCKAHDVDFREGGFSKANFTGTDFCNSLFSQTNLTSADFTTSTRYNINVYLNDINQAKFSRFEAINLLTSLNIELVD